MPSLYPRDPQGTKIWLPHQQYERLDCRSLEARCCRSNRMCTCSANVRLNRVLTLLYPDSEVLLSISLF